MLPADGAYTIDGANRNIIRHEVPEGGLTYEAVVQSDACLYDLPGLLQFFRSRGRYAER